MQKPMRMMTTVALPPWEELQIMDDLVEMCRRSKTTDVAVMVMGIPECGRGHEGLEQALEQFGRIKERLEPQGVRSGILIQSLIGHGERGRPVPDVPFQRIVGWDGTECRSCFCPLDEGFLEHTRQVVRRMARAAPAFLLVDDDTRLDNHYPAGWACACPLHVDYFNRVAGRDLDRDELFRLMRGEDEAARSLREQWFDSGEKTLLSLGRLIRQTIDEVDASIPCGKCASGGRHLFRQEPLARALAGNTRPLIRLAYAAYSLERTGIRSFGQTMAIHLAQRNLMGDDIEYMCEADTYPHTLYSTSLRTLRAFVTGAILASKIDVPYTWIPSNRQWVRSEWEAYADTMGQSEPFFRAARDLSRKTRWIGPSAVCVRPHHRMPDRRTLSWEEATFDLAWAGTICGRFGIPFTVNDSRAATAMIDGTAAESLTTGEMRKLLAGGLLLDGPAALAFARRGLAEHLGVEVEIPARSLEISLEIPTDDPVNASAAGKHLGTLMRNPSDVMRLTLRDNGARAARAASWFVRNRWHMDSRFQRIAPALTLYENTLGGRVAVHAHRLSAAAFISFLNPIRKQQIVGVLDWLARQPLPAVALTPADTCLLFGRHESTGEAVAALFNLSHDTVRDPVELRLPAPAPAPAAPKQILSLDEDGQWQPLPFEPTDEGVRLATPLETLRPLVLRFLW